MAEMVYKWKSGARAPLPAAVVGAELERIRQKVGDAFTPANVVDAARPVKSPLHPAFEWDDSVAAEEWRREQARYMIRCVVLVNPADEADEGARAFLSCTEEESGTPSYTTQERAMRDPTLRDQVLLAAYRDMHAFEKRYAQLQELAEVLESMKRVRRKKPAELHAA